METSASQVRAARALLNWSAQELSEKSGVSLSSILNFERGASQMMPRLLQDVVAVFTAAGIEFSGEGPRVSVSGPIVESVPKSRKAGAK